MPPGAKARFKIARKARVLPPEYEGPANFVRFAETFLYIKDKRGKKLPLILNSVQRRYHRAKQKAIKAGRPKKFIVLKHRRGGITTYEQAANFHTIHHPYKTCATIAHDAESTEKIFKIALFFYEKMTPEYRQVRRYQNKRQIEFEGLDSSFYIGTAGRKGFGRGDTLQRCHCSEMAWWPGSVEEHANLMVGLTEATSHGEIVIESTANGNSGFFYDLWTGAKKGINDWTPIFIPWWWDDTCSRPVANQEEADQIIASLTPEEQKLACQHNLSVQQIKWRRAKIKGIGPRLFPQEYPEDDVTCFLTSGISYFDLGVLDDLAPVCLPPLQVSSPGYQGALSIWRPARLGRAYVVGVDPSAGLPDGDAAAAGVLDVRTGEQVARLYGRWRPAELARLVVKLANTYNRAYLGVETNNHGYAVLNWILEKRLYPRSKLYHRVRKDRATNQVSHIAGWHTNVQTRPVLLADLATAIEENAMLVNDSEFLAECRGFRQQQNGKYEGDPDDLVFAWGIAWQVRSNRPPNPSILEL